MFQSRFESLFRIIIGYFLSTSVFNEFKP